MKLNPANASEAAENSITISKKRDCCNTNGNNTSSKINERHNTNSNINGRNKNYTESNIENIANVADVHTVEKTA